MKPMTLTDDVKALTERVIALEIQLRLQAKQIDNLTPKTRQFKTEEVSYPNRTITYKQEEIIKGNKV
jgi:hypothetical protein